MANPIAEHNEKIVQLLTEKPELIKDKLWRMNNCYFIITKDGKKEVFKMNRAQKHFFDTYLNVTEPYHRHVILKSRQLGFTTFIDLYILDEILFSTNKEGIIIAHKLEDAAAIFDKKIDFAIRNMADDIKGAFFRLNRNSSRKVQVTIDYGPEKGATSSIAVSVSGRSGTYHLVHISEFAKMCVDFPKRAVEVETGTFPAVPFDGFIFIESTAEGMAGRFYEMFHENWLTRDKMTPLLSQVKFMPHFYNWQYDDMEMKKIHKPIPVGDMDECEIPWEEYQKEHNLTDIEITYYYMKWLQLGGKGGTNAIHKLKQEYPTTPEEAFLSTGQSYFPTTKIASLLVTAKKGERGYVIDEGDGKVKFVANSTGPFEMFEEPQVGIQYVIGGDTAEGLAHGDAQVLYVINHKTEECAGLYRSQVPPDELVTDAYKLGKFYNWAILGIEVNKDGLWVNDGLEKLGYLNLYYRKSFDDITQKVTKYFGWKTTSATRPFALAALKAVFLRKDRGFPAALLGEMFTFIRNAKGKAEAMANKHDDCFVGLSRVLTPSGYKDIKDIKVGDMVITSCGPKLVEFTRSRYKRVINNINLTGTPTHKIDTNRGILELQYIRDDDIIHVWNPLLQLIEKLSYTEAKSIIDIQAPKGDSSVFIFGDMVNGKNLPLHYIGKYGLIIMEKYQKVLLFITRILIQIITKLKTLKQSQLKSMLDYTEKVEKKKQQKKNLNKEEDYSNLECCGENQKKEKSFLKIIQKVLFNLKKLGMLHVLIVILLLNLVLVMLNTVLVSVMLLSVIVNLVSRRKVYNLQVADTHEYIVNGILVKNCVMAASIGYAVLQEQGKYEDNLQKNETFLLSRAMFGEI